MRKLRYADPICTDPLIHRESIIYEADAIKAMKHWFPERNYTDEQALDDFIVVNWVDYVDEWE